MPAARSGAVGSEGEPIDYPALPSAAAAPPEAGPDAIARHREGQEHAFAAVLRDAVPAGANLLDGELGELPARRHRVARPCHFGAKNRVWGAASTVHGSPPPPGSRHRSPPNPIRAAAA